MSFRLLAGMLLVSLCPAALSAEEAPSTRPVRVAAMIGVVSLPRPADVAVLVRIADLFGIGFGYSDFPAFIANPLLELAGAQGGSIDARLDRFNAFDLDLRVFPFRGKFFVGSSLGRQSLQGAVTESTALGPQTATVDLTTWYATPRLGWLWTFEPGFLLAFDVGVQLKLVADRAVTVPPGATPDVTDRVNNLADLGASYPLPALRLRIGWML
ncbi:MAG: hypothetical protein ACXWLR_07195 [Myxococcales bacterium]